MRKQLQKQQHPTQSRAIRPWSFLAQAVVFCFVIFHGNRAFGQLASGTINGTVTDSQGSVIVGASVSIRNTNTQLVTATKTQSDGGFQVGALILGMYEVTFEASGFKKIVETNIRLEAAGIVKLDEHMAPGATTSTVEVNAQGANLQTETVSDSTTLEQALVENSPAVPITQSAFRDPTMLVNLVPGATGSFSGVQLAGGRTLANETLIDGAPELFQPLNLTAALVMHPSMDIVASVYTAPGVPAPEWGRESGGVVAELTKSGSSQYHGDAQVFFRNTIFDARNYNAARAGKDEQYELPVSFGGPVWIPHVYDGRKRTFFFFNFTRFWNDSTTSTVSTVPTLAERTGNFSDTIAQGEIIYNPATQTAGGVRTPFTNNTFTPTSAIGQQLANLFPKPNNGATTLNWLNYAPNGRTEAHWFYRIDHNLTDNSSLHGAFHADSSNYYQSASAFDLNNGYTTDQIMSVWHDWILTPNLLNHFMASAIHYNAVNTNYAPADLAVAPSAIPVVPGTYPLGKYAGMPPGYTFTTYSLFTPSNTPNSEWTYDYQESISWTKGKHTLKLGARFDAFQDNANNPVGLSGTFNFTASNTGVGPKQTVPTGQSAGNALASALLGLVNSASASDNVSGYGRSKYFAVYVQDSWRVTPKLTANYGIRWDMQTPIHDAKGNMSTFNPTLANTAAGGIPGAEIYAGTGTGRTGNDQFLTTWKGGYAPRVGLAYDLGHNMVVRTGYGILFAPYLLFNGYMVNPGYDQRGYSLVSSATSPDGGYTPAISSIDAGFPAANLITSNTLTPTLYNGQAVTFMDTQNGKDNRLQDNQVWQLDVQKTFGTLYIDAGYVGERGHHIVQSNQGGANNGTGIAFNQVNSKYLNLGALLTKASTGVDTTVTPNQTYLSEAQAIDPGIALPYAGFTGTIAQMLRPFPQYTNVTGVNYPSGSSSWDGFLLKVQKNYKSGFSLLAAYTWSKQFSNAGFNRVTYIDTSQDVNNSKSQKSLGDSNTPQLLVLSYLYELPLGKGKQFLNSGPLSYFVGGFGFSILQNYQSGLPIHMVPSAAALPIFNPGLFVNIVPGVPLTLSNRGNTAKYNALYDPSGTAHGTKWLNAAAFTNPAPYSFGNSRAYLDHLQQLALLNESAGFFKRTPVNADGTRYIELRAEMFNMFNRQNFSGLNATLGNPHFGEYTSEYNNNLHDLQPGSKLTEMELRIIF